MPLPQKIKDYIKKATNHLNLSNLGLLDDSALELAEILRNRPDITSIDLQSNMIGDVGAIAIITLPSIKKLNLSNNVMADEAATLLAKLLAEEKTSLESIDISRNTLTDESIKELLVTKMEGKISDKVKIALEPNTRISKTLLDQFYGRNITPEMRLASEQLDAEVNKTGDILPQTKRFLQFCSQSEQTVAKDTTNLQQTAIEIGSIIREKMVDSSRSEQIKFLQTLLTQLKGIKELRTLINLDDIKLPSISPPPSTTPPIKAQ